ncbi:hypothetical protein [Butyrivibrio sp.]|uniref:hypothetical protein n=1 Tax=Butyrivibrio sp. TaxID=28121 RepID=UPI0025B86854|nr:hypothetical protein [Butyrivibrio sp.]MBE5839713.1 hypothetical protein [Butyrivibrio sp.]
MIRKSLMKSFSVIMAAMLAMMSVACGANTVTDETAAVETQAESEIEESMVTNSAVASSESEAGKVETVYVKTDANGAVNDVIVSEWLKNADASSEMSDTTELKDIVNVKGSETFTDNGDGTLTWNASGADIYYQGTTDKELPVNMKITYTLDGKEISPEELAGKSGKVTIRFDYENKEKQTVEVNGKEIEVYTPFAMVSGMMLDSEKFSNVEISNGKVISDGGNYVVMGVAVPGLKESLDIDDEKWEELNEDGDLDEKLTNHFEVTADTTDFELGMTITMASSDILSDFGLTDLSDSDKLDDLKDDMSELNDGSTKLVDGSKELKDGTSDLRDGVTELYDGTKELKDGTKDLKDGTGKLYDGSGSLYDGVVKYTDGVGKVDDGAAKLADGASAAKDGSTKLKEGLASAKTGATTLAAGSKHFSDLLTAKLGGFDETKIKELTTQLEELKTQSAMYHAAYNYLTSGGECSDELYAFINTLAGGKIESKKQLAEMVEAGKSTLQATSTTSVTTEANGDNLEQDVETDTITNPENDTDDEDIEETEEVTNDTEEVKENTEITTETTTTDTTTTDTTTETTTTDTTISGTATETTPETTTSETTEGTNTADLIGESKVSTTGTTVTLSLEDLENDSLGQYYTDEEIAAMLEESKALSDEEKTKIALEYVATHKSGVFALMTSDDMVNAIKSNPDKMAEAVKKLDPVTLGKLILNVDDSTLGAIIANMDTDTLVSIMSTMDESKIASLLASSAMQAKLASILNTTEGQAALAPIMTPAIKEQVMKNAPVFTSYGQLVGATKAGYTAIDQVLAKVQASGLDVSSLGKIQEAVAAAKQIADGSAALSSGINQLYDGAGTLEDGLGQLSSGASQLHDGTKELVSNNNALVDGAYQLNDGARQLDDGAGKLNDGAIKLNDGVGELNDGAIKLDDGVQELLDGVIKLDEEGIKKLYEAFDGDLTEFADRMTAIKEAGESYTSFGGASEDVDSSVKFIIKTDAIKSL